MKITLYIPNREQRKELWVRHVALSLSTPYNRCTAVASGIVYGRDTFVEIQTVTFDIPGLEGQLEA